MALSQYVHVNISVGTAAPTQQGFGTLLILTNAPAASASVFTTNEVRSYRTFSALTDDFNSNEFPYYAGLAAFSQQPRPELIKVGILPTPSTGQTISIDVTNVASSSNITGSLISPAASASVVLASWSSTHAGLALNLANAIGAFSGISASAAGNVVTATAGTPGALWHFSDETVGIKILDTTGDWDYNDQLDNLLDIDSDFYAVAIDNNSAKNIDKVARWAAANSKLAFFAPQVTDPDDWTSSLFTAAADYTSLLANDNAVLLLTKDTRVNAKEVAWAASQLVEDPGTITWAFKSLEAVGTDTWTASEESTITGDDVGGNVYKTEAGIDITYPGKTAGGEWIDVVRTKDWLQARIQERIFGLLANAKKVPYTDKGLNMILAEVKAQLREAELRQVIDSGWSATVLPVLEQATLDRANRIVRQVEFTARLAGAVHEVYVVGTVSV